MGETHEQTDEDKDALNRVADIYVVEHLDVRADSSQISQELQRAATSSGISELTRQLLRLVAKPEADTRLPE